jgi:hypothetical protein
MNPVARENLIRKLEHLVRHEPAGGTLFMTVARTTHMLVATLEDGEISLAYPHTGRFDFLRRYRFGSFCKARGFAMRRDLWGNVRVTRALIGADTTDAAQKIAECFIDIYRLSGPFGLHLQGMGWQTLGDRRKAESIDQQ